MVNGNFFNLGMLRAIVESSERETFALESIDSAKSINRDSFYGEQRDRDNLF